MSRLIPRSEWGNRYGLGWKIRPLPATTAWLHHSVTNAPGPGASLAEDIAHMRLLDQIGYQRFNYADKGWARPAGAGISYSAVVMPSGRVFEGHGINRSSSHTSGYNTHGIGICIAGNYDRDEPTPAALESAAWVLTEFKRRGQLRTARYNGGHRDSGFATSCPGNRLHRKLGSINTRASQLEAGRGGITPPPEPEPDRGRDAQAFWLGSTGDDVKSWQRDLTALGYPLDDDGHFGPATDRATRAFQSDYGINAHGQVGPRTITTKENAMATVQELDAKVDRILGAVRRDLTDAEKARVGTGRSPLSILDVAIIDAGRNLTTMTRTPTNTHAQLARLEAAVAEVNGHEVDVQVLARLLAPVIVEAVRDAGGDDIADRVVDSLAKRLGTTLADQEG